MTASIKDRLGLIRKASSDARERIGVILTRDDKIDIATLDTSPYAKDLFHLMKDAAHVANGPLRDMGLSEDAIDSDIEEYVRLLEDNDKEHYFASLNIDAKYNKNRKALTNLSKWFLRLEGSIDKIESFIDESGDSQELSELFRKIDRMDIPDENRDELKGDFLRVLTKAKYRNHQQVRD